jgi:interleukin-1 receptor-associated kinase 4
MEGAVYSEAPTLPLAAPGHPTSQFPLPSDVPGTRELDSALASVSLSLEPGERGEDLSLLQSPLPVFGFSFLERITGHWSSVPRARGGNLLGSGAFGSVYYGELEGQLGLENSYVAVKRLSRDTPNIERLFGTEVEMMGLVSHKHLLPLLAYSSDGADLCLLYPFMEGGSLQERLACRAGRPALTPMQRLRIARGCAEGLHYLHTHSHTKPLVHRDVKTANILLDGQDEPKVGDFGLVRLGEQPGQGGTLQTAAPVGTSVYMAPEAHRGEIGPRLDVFSLGVVMLELLTGLPPVIDGAGEDGTPRDIISHLDEVADIEPLLDGRFSLMEWRGVFPLRFHATAERCLAMRRRQRPDMAEVVELLKALFN